MKGNEKEVDEYVSKKSWRIGMILIALILVAACYCVINVLSIGLKKQGVVEMDLHNHLTRNVLLRVRESLELVFSKWAEMKPFRNESKRGDMPTGNENIEPLDSRKRKSVKELACGIKPWGLLPPRSCRQDRNGFDINGDCGEKPMRIVSSFAVTKICDKCACLATHTGDLACVDETSIVGFGRNEEECAMPRKRGIRRHLSGQSRVFEITAATFDSKQRTLVTEAATQLPQLVAIGSAVPLTTNTMPVETTFDANGRGYFQMASKSVSAHGSGAIVSMNLNPGMLRYNARLQMHSGYHAADGVIENKNSLLAISADTSFRIDKSASGFLCYDASNIINSAMSLSALAGVLVKFVARPCARGQLQCSRLSFEGRKGWLCSGETFNNPILNQQSIFLDISVYPDD